MKPMLRVALLFFVSLLVSGCSLVEARQAYDENTSGGLQQHETIADDTKAAPSMVPHAYRAEPNVPPTYVNVTQEHPLASVTSDAIASMRMCFPMVGEYELTDDEIADFADSLSSLKLKETIDSPIYGFPGLCSIEIEFENGELWLLQFPQTRTETNQIEIGMDENSRLLLEGDENIAFVPLYYSIEEKATESFSDTLEPFESLSQDDLARVGYQYFTYENGLEYLELPDDKAGELLEFLRNMEIDPQTGTHDLYDMVGGLVGLTGTNKQFLLEFVDGSSLYVGAGGEDLCIDGVLYQPTDESAGTLALLNTFYLRLK